MYALIHDDPSCGAIAFLMPNKPLPGSPKSSANVLYPDGRPVELGAPMRCSHCLRSVNAVTRNIRLMI